MTGLHITADCNDCTCNNAVLIDPKYLLSRIREKVKAVGLTALQDSTHQFSQGQHEQSGFTTVVLLAESHISVHTWPEKSYVSMDVYVCNHSNDNSDAARKIVIELIELFKPGSTVRNEVTRGHREQPLRHDAEPELHLEWLSDSAAFGFKARSVLERRHSKFQFIEVLDCPHWGHTLRLDDRYMTSDVEGFIYHELMVHPTMAAHRSASSILIVGGGDGGTLREVLRYSAIESIDLVEIDLDVIEVSRRHLQSVNDNAFEDRRVSIHVNDAQAYIRGSHRMYDLIFLDLTDERPPAKHLYGETFFALLKTRLTSGGAIVLHCGSPYYDAKATAAILGRVRAEFAVVRPFGAYIPLYGTYLLFVVASQSLDVRNTGKREITNWIENQGLTGLRYYDPDMHHAVFSIPNFLKAALALT